MSISLSFRWHRLQAKVFFWLFGHVSRLYFYLDTAGFKKYRVGPGVFSKETVALARAVGDSQCVDSGRCAIKNWTPDPEISKRIDELAWKAKQETSQADIYAYHEKMKAVSQFRDLTPEEIAAAKTAMASINKLDVDYLPRSTDGEI